MRPPREFLLHRVDRRGSGSDNVHFLLVTVIAWCQGKRVDMSSSSSSSSIVDRTNHVNEVIKGGPVVMTLAREVHGVDAYLPGLV